MGVRWIDFHLPLLRERHHRRGNYIRPPLSVCLVSGKISEHKMIANIHQVLAALELAGTITCTWPLHSNVNNRKIVLRNMQWTFAIFNVTLLMVSLVFGIYRFRGDIIVLMKSLSELTALLEVLFDLIFCKIYTKQLQVLIGKMKIHLEMADEHERRAVQSYVDRYKKFFSAIAVAYISTGISFCLAPLLSKQQLPADGWIPFSIEPFGIYCVVYIVQVYCILQTALCIGVDFMITTLFCYPAARLDVLSMRMKQVRGQDLLVSCVKEHQEIIRFVEDAKAAVQALLFKTNITMGSAVICGAFPLVYNQSLTVTGQFLCMVIAGCGHLYVISWPADDLKESRIGFSGRNTSLTEKTSEPSWLVFLLSLLITLKLLRLYMLDLIQFESWYCNESLRFAISVIDIQWIGKPREMTSIVLIMMQRSRKPFLIKMGGGLFPALSLEYFANFLTTTSSYFMAMRTMIES